MKKVLLVTTLLSIAMSENILVENHSRAKRLWIRDKQYKKAKQGLLQDDDGLPEMEEFSNYDDDRQFPRISDTRFIGETMKLPSLALVRRANVDKPKLNIGKPSILISIGIQDTSNDLQENCSTKKNYRKHNQDWQLQQPFYVDEPRWIEIDPEYADGLPQHVDDGDPYILSRGKKVYRIKDPERANKIIDDYEFPDYGKGKRPLTKSRVRRSIKVETDEVARGNVHQNERLNVDEDRVVLNVRGKRSATPRNERSAEVRKKYMIHQVDWNANANSNKLIEKNGMNVFERMEDEYDINKLDNLDVLRNNALISSRGKNKPSENEILNRERVSYKELIDKPWKTELHVHHKEMNDKADKSEMEANAAASAAAADSPLASLPEGPGKAPGIPAIEDSPKREKRNACQDFACVSSQPDDWLRNIEREIQDSLLLERRDKHRDILESLQLSEPYVISRGKKTPHVQDRVYSTLQSRMVSEDGRVRTLNLSPTTRSLLRMLLTASTSCCSSSSSNSNFDVNALELTPGGRQEVLIPRDRRGTLDEILAGYDPYYVARGKRTSPGMIGKMIEMIPGMQTLQSQKNQVPDKDAARNGRLQ